MPILKDGAIEPDQGTVAHGLLDMLFEHCVSNGLDPSSLKHIAGLPVIARPDAANRMPFRTFSTLCDSAEKILNQPELGIVMGLGVRPEHLGGHGWALATCGSFRELSKLSLQYSRTVMDGFQNVLVDDGQHTVRIWQNDNGPDGHDVLQDELNVAIWISMASKIIGKYFLRPLWVSFRHAPRFDPRLYRQLLGTEVRFHSSSVSIGINRVDPDLPLPGAEPAANLHFKTQCRRELACLMAGKGMVLGAVQATMERALPDVPTLSDVARSLALSPRQLRYQLNVRDTTYGRISDLVRHRRATQLMREGHCLTDISAALGFSEQSAFNRAYRRWSQVTPGKARASLVNEMT